MSQLIEAQRAQHFDRVQVGNLPFPLVFPLRRLECHFQLLYSIRKIPYLRDPTLSLAALAHIPTSTPFVSLCPRYMRMITLTFTVPG